MISIPSLLAGTVANLRRIPVLHWLALLVVLSATNAIDFGTVGRRDAGAWLAVGLALRVVGIFWVFVATLRVLTNSPVRRWALNMGVLRYIGLALAQLAVGLVIALAIRAAFPAAPPEFAVISSIAASLIGLRFVLLFVDAAYGAPFRPRAAWWRLRGLYPTAAGAWAVTVLPLVIAHFALTLYAVKGGLDGGALMALAAFDGIVSALLAGLMLSLHAAIWLETRSS